MRNVVIDSRLGCSQKTVEFRTQRKIGHMNSRVRAQSCGILDFRLFWNLLDRIPEGKLTKGRSTQESCWAFLRKTYLKVRNKSSHCGGTQGTLAEVSEFKGKIGGYRRWETKTSKEVYVSNTLTLWEKSRTVSLT